MPEQLCWSCGKACGGCSWSRRYEKKPVPGWTATPRKIKMAVKTCVQSYAITKCPEYVQDCEDSSKPRKFFTMAALLYDAAKKSDVEIGRALGVCPAVVSAWRNRTGRPAIAKGGRPKGDKT